MKKGIAYIAMFLTGAVIGSGTTYLLIDKKLENEYRKRTEEEIESVRSGFAKMQKDIFERNEAQKAQIMEKWKSEELSDTLGYSSENDQSASETIRDLQNKVNNILDNVQDNITIEPLNRNEKNINADIPLSKNEIYLISQEEFGINDDYQIENLTYYSNGIVTNEVDDLIEKPEDLLSSELYDLLGVYSNSGFTETYIRNERNMTDYEIDFADYDFLDS